jgi:hypothetical protein
MDQIELPLARPMLDIFLALDRGWRGIVLLVVHEQFDAVLLAKAFDKSLAVLVHTTQKVIGHANINCAVAFAGEDINPKYLHCCDIVWIAESSPAMTAEYYVPSQSRRQRLVVMDQFDFGRVD